MPSVLHHHGIGMKTSHPPHFADVASKRLLRSAVHPSKGNSHTSPRTPTVVDRCSISPSLPLIPCLIPCETPPWGRSMARFRTLPTPHKLSSGRHGSWGRSVRFPRGVNSIPHRKLQFLDDILPGCPERARLSLQTLEARVRGRGAVACLPAKSNLELTGQVTARSRSVPLVPIGHEIRVR